MLRYILVFCLFFVVRFAFSHATQFFRRDYSYVPATRSFYKFHTIQRDWADAKKRCQLEGATFFYPESKAEVEAVLSIWDIKNYPSAYIAVSDLLSKGSFESIDGKSIFDIYNRWAPGEPNDKDGDENCVVLSKDGTLNDDTCSKRLPFICKKTADSVEWNALCDMHDPTYQYNADMGKCYKFHRDPTNWNQAYTICNAEDSYLAVINSQKEADFLIKLTEETDKNIGRSDYLAGHVHLGVHNLYGDGWVTVRGATLRESGYSRWGGGQPDNSSGNEKCAGMFYNGHLNDITCDRKCFFICEHDIGILNNDVNERLGLINKVL